MVRLRTIPFSAALLLVLVAVPSAAQNSVKRNDRPPETASPAPERRENNQKPADQTRYSYEFKQPQFLITHIVIEHDAAGHGKISFERKGEETPIDEPVELSATAWARILGLWKDLRFLDSNENYQAPKNFAHLGIYWIGMDDGKRKRTAEFNWSNNKSAWGLAMEYRHVADQAILIFNLNVARELQPLNVPQFLNEMEMLMTRNELSDPKQLVPLLTDLRTDEHIPLLARNQADRILKKIAK